MKAQTPNNPKILCDLITSRAESGSKREVMEELQKVDEQYLSSQIDCQGSMERTTIALQCPLNLPLLASVQEQ